MDSRANARSAWARIRKNLAVILGERAVFAVVNFAAAAIAARAAGVEALGAVGLLLAYARIVSDVVNFNSWQAVLSYGAPLLETGRDRDLRRLFGLTLWLDIGAVVISVGAAALAAPAIGAWLNWSDEMIQAAPWFAIIIAFFTHMTPTGVLRLYDRAPLLTLMHAITATLRLAGVCAIWAWGGGFLALAAVWAGAAIGAGLVIWALAAAEMVRQRALPRLAAVWREGAEGFAGFKAFVVSTNLILTLDRIVFQVATLLVGAVLGPFEAGLFYIVRQITETMVRPGDLLGPLFFPEIALLEAKGDRRAMRQLVRRAMIYTGLILVVVLAALIFGGGYLLTTLFGAEAAAGHQILILTGIASALLVWGFTLEPTLLSIGRADQALWSVALAWVIFAGLCWLLIADWGLAAVGVAMIGHRATQFLIRFALVAHALRRTAD